MEMFFVICYVAFIVIVGVMASNRDRSAIGWIVIAILISPLLAMLLLLAFGTGNSKTCPKCAEKVKEAACVCRHCGHDFKPALVTSATASF